VVVAPVCSCPIICAASAHQLRLAVQAASGFNNAAGASLDGHPSCIINASLLHAILREENDFQSHVRLWFSI